MTTYILRRLLQAVPVLIGISIFTFLMLYLTPGDPVSIIAGDKPISQEQEEQLRAKYGLDGPLWERYLDYMSGVLQGDFGESFRTDRPVTESIGEALWPTIQLTIAGLFVAVVLGISLGIIAAIFYNTWIDTLAMVVALLGVSMPVFYLGLLLLFGFSFEIQLFPATGTGGWQHLILPAITVGFASSAYIARLVRSSMLETLRQDYVVTARSKGLRERVVVTPSCPQERTDPGGDLHRDPVGWAAQWGGGDGAGLLPAWAGPGRRHGDRQSGFPPDPGDGPDYRRDLRAGEPARGPLLRDLRSEDSVWVSPG